MQDQTGRRDAFEENECLLCVPAPHPNCEMYTTLAVVDVSKVPFGESDEDHLISIPVCLEHYQAFDQYQCGRNVNEVDV